MKKYKVEKLFNQQDINQENILILLVKDIDKQLNKYFYHILMNDLEKTRIKMMNNFDVATELYLKCKNAGCNDVLHPINWLCNQSVLIEAYKKFKNKHKNDDNNFLLLFIQKMNLLIIWILCVKIFQLDSGIN